jgi:uncharacterized repeat protein (TIGR01451 family)
MRRPHHTRITAPISGGARGRAALRRVATRILAPMVLLVSATGIAVLVPAGPAAHAVIVPPAVTYTSTGLEQSYTVPPGVTSIIVQAVGGAGADGHGLYDLQGGGSGGTGASVTATLAVTPSEVFYVEVGGAGVTGTCGDFDTDNTSGNAFNGGGSSECGGGGGGASDLRTCSMATCPNLTPDTRQVVAGGGGGGGLGGDLSETELGPDGGSGGRAGDSAATGAGAGGDGCDSCTVGNDGLDGGFGVEAGGAGGAGTTDFAACAGLPGTRGLGGDEDFACDDENTGGAGGGGYFGGGAGGDAENAGGGGGAGSSFWVSTASDTSMTEIEQSAEVVITPDIAQVSVSKGALTTGPTVGSSDSFSLTASNAGPADSGQVVVTDVVPAGLTYASSSSATGTIGNGGSGQTVTWTIPDLGSTSTATAQIVVTVASASPSTNTATFSQTTPTILGTTTGSSNSVTVTPVYAVVSVTKAATTPYVTTSGAQSTFTLTAANAGPNDAGKVVVTDVIPAGLVIVHASTATGTIGLAGQTVTWTITDLSATGPGSSASAQIVVNVVTTATANNTATFSQTTPNATGVTTGNSNTVGVVASCSPGLTTYHLTATSRTGNFTGIFCVNAAGSGLYLQSGGAHGTGAASTSGGTAHISAFGTNLALLGQKSPSSNAFTETAPAPMTAGTFTLV